MNKPVMDVPKVDVQGKGAGSGPDWQTYKSENDALVKGNLKSWEADHKKIAEGESAAAKLASTFGTEVTCEKQRKDDLAATSKKLGERLGKLAGLQQQLKCLAKKKDAKSKEKAEKLKSELEKGEAALKKPESAWQKALKKAEGKDRKPKVDRAEKMNGLATSGG